MAKKKRTPPKRTSKRAASARAELPPERLPDRRAMEGAMWGAFRGLSGGRRGTPLEKAQELMYEAFGQVDPEERVALAQRALATSPDCADAFVLLAEHAETRRDAIEFYKQGVAAGERALGPATFKNDAGHFWGMLETRPYMRAREGLAHMLWVLGHRNEAIGHLQEMLRLNPNDNQGVRYALSTWLISAGRDEELAALLAAYDEPTAMWLYGKALATFRREGDTAAARARLAEAKAQNPHVLAVLIGMVPLPPLGGSYTRGSEEEAAVYLNDAMAAWKMTPGAIDWVRQSESKRGERSATETGAKAAGPQPRVKQELAKLRTSKDVWQAGIHQMKQPVDYEGTRVRPILVLVLNQARRRTLKHGLMPAEPTSSLLWEVLVEAMRAPMTGKPHRPATLQVTADDRWRELTPHLEELGIKVEVVAELKRLHALGDALEEDQEGQQPPALVDGPEIQTDQLADFYHAAAEFYRAAPWRLLALEAAIEVTCDRFGAEPWYAIVMGQSGMTFGLALYPDLEQIRMLWSGHGREHEIVEGTSSTAVTFDDPIYIADADLEAVRQHGFEIAAPNAYPWLCCVEPGHTLRAPLASELDMFRLCLRAVPELVAQRLPDDASPYTVAVDLGKRRFDVRLAWVQE